jgi:hypothetical protein
MRVIEPLSAWTKANGRLPLACRHSSPMTPPWTTAATVVPGSSPSTREAVHGLGTRDDVPALLREDLRDARVALRDRDPERPAVELAEVDLA